MIQTIIGKDFPKKVIPYIDAANKSISIVVFDWRWYPQDPGSPVQLFNQAIVRAVRRGVVVRAISNNDEIVRILNNNGVRAVRLVVKNLVHAKLMIIDEAITITGSHNYTTHAFTENIELSLLIDSPELAKDTLLFFDKIYALT